MPAPARPRPQVQDHGVAMLVHGGEARAFAEGSLASPPRVLAVAESCGAVLGVGAQQALGAPLTAIMSRESVAAVCAVAASADPRVYSPFRVDRCEGAGSGPAGELAAVVHVTDEGVVVDVEPAGDNDPFPEADGEEEAANQGCPRDAASHIRLPQGLAACHRLAAAAIERLRSITDLGALNDALVHEVRRLTGYDRCMLYVLHEDQHGEVVAEARRDKGVDSFLGIHFPATDLPQVNRRLLQEHPRPRLLASASRAPARVRQVPELGARNILLGNSQLRATLGCHAQYLANMGVAGTLVVPIAVSQAANSPLIPSACGAGEAPKGKVLWGMVVNHNSKPRYVSYAHRAALGMLMQVYASQVEQELRLRAARRLDRAARAHARVIELVLADDPLREMAAIIAASPDSPGSLMDAVPFDCDGVIVCDGAGQALSSAGKRPPDRHEAEALAGWLITEGHLQSESDKPRIFLSSALGRSDYPRAAEACAAGLAGVVAMPLPSGIVKREGGAGGSANLGGVVLYTRQELRATVKWAGAKGGTDAIVQVAGGGGQGAAPRLTPRASFATVMEKHEGGCLAWPLSASKAVGDLMSVLADAADAANGSLLRAGIVSVVSQQRMHSLGELKKVASELRLLSDRAAMAVVHVGADGTVLSWNNWLVERSGVDASEAIGRPLSSFLEGGGSAPLVVRMNECLARKEEQRDLAFGLLVGGAPGGQDGIAQLVGDVVPAVGGPSGGGGAVVIAQETPTRSGGRQREERAIFEALQTPVIAVGAEGRVQMWNRAMERLTSDSVKSTAVHGLALMGDVISNRERSPLRVTSQEELLRLELAIMHTMRPPGTMLPPGAADVSDVALSLKCRDRVLDLGLSIRPRVERSEHGTKANGCLIYVQDVSIRRALDKAVAVRMAAEAAVAAKAHTISYLCHEIRNPLNGIVAATELMQNSDDTLPDLHRELLSTTDSCSRQLRHIVDDVLDVTAIEQGKFQVKHEPFDMVTLIHDCLLSVAPAATEKGLTLATDLGRLRGRNFVGDSTRTMQLLANVVWNAVKYTESGMVEIHASSAARMASGQDAALEAKSELVTLAVVDSGIGIAAEDQKKLFNCYELSAARFTRYGSTGLGLHFSRSMARRLGGDVTCRSVLSVGSIFECNLPLRPQDGGLGERPPQHGLCEFSVTDMYGNALCSHLNSLEQALRGASDRASTVPSAEDTGRSGDDDIDAVGDGADARGGGAPTVEASVAAVVDAGFAAVDAVSGTSTDTTVSVAPSPATTVSSSSPSVDAQSLPPPAGPSRETVDYTSSESSESERPLRILIADDEVTNQRVLQLSLRKRGAPKSEQPLVTITSDGHATLSAVLTSRQRFDIALIDEVMPGHYGSEVTRQLRLHEIERTTTGAPFIRMPIIIVTANSMPTDVKKYQKVGVDYLCAKPVPAMTLLSSVTTIVETARAGGMPKTDLPGLLKLSRKRSSKTRSVTTGYTSGEVSTSDASDSDAPSAIGELRAENARLRQALESVQARLSALEVAR